MKLLCSEKLQELVDYSFGDQSGVLGGVPNAYMKKANIENGEFISAMIGVQNGLLDDYLKIEHRPMTLFIDNIRLYRRPLEYSDWLHNKPISPEDKKWLNQFADEDLLNLCAQFLNQKFIIFTALEDTPLDGYVWNKIPDNVIAIHAANGVVFGGKIHPYPHGLERKMYEGYNHQELLTEALETTVEPHKALLVCHRDDTGSRGSIKDIFKGQSWATVAPKLDYPAYLQAIQNHKFVLCPSGNGIESARNWETLYMRRVPVFKRHTYLEEMFEDFPALFVDDFEEVTEELLTANEHLFEQAQEMDMTKLDLDYWFKKCTNV